MAIPLDETTLEIMCRARQVPEGDRARDSNGRLIGAMLTDPVTDARVWLVLEEPGLLWCPHIYACPQNGEFECLCHGGFDVCCGHSACPGAEVNQQRVGTRPGPHGTGKRVVRQLSDENRAELNAELDANEAPYEERYGIVPKGTMP